MKQKIKLKQVISSLGSLNRLGEKRLPVKLSYRVSKITNKLKPHVEAYGEAIDKLMKEYGQYDTKSGKYLIKTENKKAVDNFIAQSSGLEQEDVEIEFEKIPFAMFEYEVTDYHYDEDSKKESEEKKKATIEPSIFSDIAWLIEE